MIRTVVSWLRNAVRKPGGTVMALLTAAALVSPVIMLMANAEHKAALSGTADAGTVYYVTPAGTGDGSSWANAMGSADFAASMDEFAPKVTVALAGTAKTGAAATTSLDVTFYLKKGQYDLTRTLPLTKGVKVYGGFDGTETAPGQRNITAIMSGDNAMSADHATILSRDASVSADVKFSIVTGGAGATSADTVLDGVTVTGGNGMYGGGGMFNYSSSPTVTNCTFSGNSARTGGAIHNDSADSNPTVTGCTFRGNSANNGGAIYNYGTAIMTNCSFSGNSANYSYGGGAIYNDNGTATMTNCSFSGNSAYSSVGGGAIYNDNATATMTNCSFSGNSAGSGGAIYNRAPNNPFSGKSTVINCTFSGNSANGSSGPNEDSAGGGGGAIYNMTSNLAATNCTFSGNKTNVSGGAVYNYGSASVCNSVFWDNSTSAASNDIDNYNNATPSVSLDIRYSVIATKIGQAEYGDDAVINITSSDLVTGDPNLAALDRGLNALADGYASTDVYAYAIPSGSSAEKLGPTVGSHDIGGITVTIQSDDQTGFMRDAAVSSDAGAYALHVKSVGAISSVTVTPASLTLAAGTSANLTLSADMSPSLSTFAGSVKWVSSAENIAAAAGNGMSAIVTAVKKGAADITATLTVQTGPRVVNGAGESKSELTGTAASVVTVTEDEPVSPDVPVSPDKPTHSGGSGCNAGATASGLALLALCLPILIKRRKR